AQLCPKYRAATWLQNDDRRVGKNMRSKRGQVATQIRLRHIEETVVVESPAAADMLIQHLNLAACMLQNFYCRLRRFWHEVVVECISPQKHFRPRTWTRFASAEPRPERLRSERWDLSSSWNPHRHFGDVAQA